MNFNKNYPIVVIQDIMIFHIGLDILSFLKYFNIVILDSFIENFNSNSYFINCIKKLSKETDLYKDGYKLKNGCMLYIDADYNNKKIYIELAKTNNSYIRYIACARNLKEKYKNMKVVILTKDNLTKLTASLFDVETKTLEELISSIEIEEKDMIQIIKFCGDSRYSYCKFINVIVYKNGYVNMDIDTEIYDIILNYILKGKIDRNGLNGFDKLLELINIKNFFILIFDTLSKNNDIDGLEKLYKILNDDFELDCKNLVNSLEAEGDKSKPQIDVLKAKINIPFYENLLNTINSKIKQLDSKDPKFDVFEKYQNYLQTILNRINDGYK